jgi:hypothetical protein
MLKTQQYQKQTTWYLPKHSWEKKTLTLMLAEEQK